MCLQVALGPKPKQGASVVTVETNGKTTVIGTLNRDGETSFAVRAAPRHQLYCDTLVFSYPSDVASWLAVALPDAALHASSPPRKPNAAASATSRSTTRSRSATPAATPCT